MELKESKNRIR